MIKTLDHLIVAVNNLEEAEQNYQKILGINPSWRGHHKEWGTSNSLFSFQNTYLELLAATGEGMGAQLVKNKIKNDGEGLMGIVLGTDDLEAVRNKLIALGYSLPSQSNGEGINTNNNSKRSWINQFLPIELTRGLFSFIIHQPLRKVNRPGFSRASGKSDASVREASSTRHSRSYRARHGLRGIHL